MFITTGYKKAREAAMELCSSECKPFLAKYKGTGDWQSQDVNIWQHPTKKVYAVTFSPKSIALYFMSGGQ